LNIIHAANVKVNALRAVALYIWSPYAVSRLGRKAPLLGMPGAART
jgi:hypothetical protein